MKNSKLAISILAIAMLFLGGWFLGRVNSHHTQQVQAQDEQGIDIKALESSLNLIFTPADINSDIKISKDDAIARATETEEKLKEATSVTAELGYLSNPNLEEASKNGEKVDSNLDGSHLVWIVSFQGIESVSSGPPESDHNIAHEYNVVIDSTTGEFVIGFIYR